MAREPLTDDELAAELSTLPRWALVDGSLTTTVTAANFSEAFGFMARVALAAEVLDHHPDWSNSWATVEIALRTHDRDAVTALDVALARAIDEARPDHPSGVAP